MISRDRIQSYINNFRRQISPYLKPGVGLKCQIYQANQEGAILEFRLGQNEKNEDIYLRNYQTVNQALRDIEQSAFGGNLDAFDFKGTNYVLENKRIILVKGTDSLNHWDESASKKDVNKLIND